MNTSPARLTNDALLAEVKRLAQCEREIIATLVAHLVEVERRDLFRAEGCSSMFTYCTEVLGYSEDAAYMRLQAARAAREVPEILEELSSGALHLSALRYLAPYLGTENRQQLIAASRHKSKREVEKLVRCLHPLPEIPATVRKLPEPIAVSPEAAPANAAPEREVEPVPRPSVVAPLAAERYKVQFTASATLHDKLRRAQDLLRHRIPSGDVAQVTELALEVLVEKLEKQKFAATGRPRAGRELVSGSREIPARVKRAVWQRDGGRCAYVGNGGRRCRETGFLEFHHVMPFAHRGAATVANIALRCRSHNQYEAKLEFGIHPPMVRESSVPWGLGARESSALWGLGARESSAPWVIDSELRGERLETGVETWCDVFPGEGAIA